MDDGFNAFSGEYNAIAIDSLGKVHISYYYVDFDTHIAEVRHATNASSAWIAESVFSAGETGSFIKSTSIALDSSNHVYISYSDWSTLEVKYASNASGSWIHQTVDTIAGQFTSIALDLSGNAHISYYDFFNRALKYAANSSGAWISEAVDNTVERDTPVGKYTSIAVDSADRLHVSYFEETYDPFHGSLKYANNSSGSWVTETVDLAGGNDTSLALDSSGNVHISYGWAGGLKYATNASGAWMAEAVDNNPDAGSHTSIAIDNLRRTHISYLVRSVPLVGAPFLSLRYATNVSGSWVIETVDVEVGGFGTSIAFDSSGKVHISYTERGLLRHATNASGSWVTETVDSGVGTVVGSYFPDIALDKEGNVHISYSWIGGFGWDWMDRLRYATNASGSWVTEDVDSNIHASYTSVAIDSLSHVHISYYDSANKDLRHATNAFCGWVTETVDSNGSVGQFNSIALDSSNNVHISYFDDDSGSLKYATTLPISDIVVCPQSHDFGGVFVNSQSNQVITIANNGYSGLVIGPIAGANPLSEPFSIAGDNCSNQTIASLSACTVTTGFTPVTTGVFNDTFDIPSSDPDQSSVTVSLTGTAVAADLALTKTDSPDPITVGSNFTYTITVTNNGPSEATDITLTDTLPTAVTFVEGTFEQGDCSGTTTAICNLGNLASGTSTTVTITVTPTTSGTITNTASVTSNVPDPDTANNSATASTTVYAPLSGDNGSSGPCFIATAAYGSYLAPEVQVLRKFRDDYLMTNSIGRSFVALYYEVSPPIAGVIRDHEALRAATRWILAPVIYGVLYPGFFVLFVSGTAVIVLAGRRLKSKREW
ncbi:MAG: DUF11 domain-containing protein [Nitrospirae bacterium]|nr:DUF11 domain-containing protein [Nitrospirota bacterium]